MKSHLVHLVSIFSYWLGIDYLFYILNRKAKRILTFHNVMPQKYFCQKTTVLSDSEDTFRKKIRELKKYWSFSTDVNDPKTLTITFDDGFVNEAEVAGQILKEEGNIPAILFTVTNLIDETDCRKAPVVDLLTHWNACVPNGTYEINVPGLDPVSVTYVNDNRGQVWIQILRPLYASDAEHLGLAVLDACNRVYSMEKIFAEFSAEYLRLRLTGVSSQQIADLRRRGWKVGSHSCSHYVFSSLKKEMKISELLSDAEMKETVFSYPYGEMRSIDVETIALTQSAGYPGAVSNLPDGGRRCSPYFLPRMTLPSNIYDLHFELSGFKTFLKTRKLLPVIRITE